MLTIAALFNRRLHPDGTERHRFRWNRGIQHQAPALRRIEEDRFCPQARKAAPESRYRNAGASPPSIRTNGIKVLNVAVSRLSGEPRIAEFVVAALKAAKSAGMIAVACGPLRSAAPARVVANEG
jgi:hypothetical protein